MGGSSLVLLDDGSCLIGVEAGAVEASVTRLDARLAVVGGGEGLFEARGAASGDTARGVAAGPGVGGAETSERSESPSKASIVRASVDVCQFGSCDWLF